MRVGTALRDPLQPAAEGKRAQEPHRQARSSGGGQARHLLGGHRSSARRLIRHGMLEQELKGTGNQSTWGRACERSDVMRAHGFPLASTFPLPPPLPRSGAPSVLT